MTPTIRQAPSPNHGGIRLITRGCVLHSTRGGAQTVEAEYTATLHWFANPAAQVSAHIVIAANGEIARCIEEDLVAWHDPSSNATMLGVELVQPQLGDAISDAQVSSLAWWLTAMADIYGFLLTPLTLPFHSQTRSGIAEGKTDAYPRGAAGDAFRARLQAALGG